MSKVEDLVHELREARAELESLKTKTMYHGEWVDVCAPHDRFVAFASKLRELGATQVTDGTMSVTFAPQPKLVATLPLTRTPTEAPPGVERVREWRDGDGHVVVNPPLDPNSKEARDAARVEILQKLGMVK